MTCSVREGLCPLLILMYYFSVLKDLKARSLQSFPVSQTKGASVTYVHANLPKF